MSQDAEIEQGGEPSEEKKKLSLTVKIDQPNTCQRHVTVTIAREDIDRYLSEAVDEIAPKAQVPGFRPGRAPRELVEKRFHDQVADQVKSSLLMDSMTQVTEDHDFAAISEPQFELDAIRIPEEGPLTFEFNIEVRPEFDVPEWKGLQLERPTHVYSEEEVDRHLERVLARYGHLEPREGPAQLDDYLTLKITSRLGDRVLAEFTESSVRVKPSLSFRDGQIQGFDTLMTGVQVGDRREATLTLSSDAEHEELRGKEVKLEFEVQEISHLQLPKLTAAFLDRIGGFEDEDELRDAVRKELERQVTYLQQKRIREQITANLTQQANWELPPDLLRRQARRELERSVLELRSHGFSEDMIRAHQNEIRQNSLRATETALKEHFILERIAEEHKIDASPEDYETEVRQIANQSGANPRRVRARLERQGQWDALRNQIVERKVIGLITDQANFKDVPLELKPQDVHAIDRALSGAEDEEAIPEAQHAEEQNLPQPVTHS